MNGRTAANLQAWAKVRPWPDPEENVEIVMLRRDERRALDLRLLVELASLVGTHTWGLALDAALENVSELDR